MIEFFNTRRFFSLVWRLLSERGIKLFGSILLIACFGVMMRLGIMEPGSYANDRYLYVIFGLVFGPVIYTWIIANEFDSDSKGIGYLLLPNSTIEKWFLNTIMGLGSYFLIFCFIFRMMDRWVIHSIQHKYGALPEYEGILSSLQVYSFDQPGFLIPLFMGVIVGLGILIGALQFRKNALFYSLLSLFGLLLLAMGIHFFIAKAFFGKALLFGPQAVIPFSYLLTVSDFGDKPIRRLVYLPYDGTRIVFSVFIPTITLIALIYFAKLKEKQL